MRVTAPSDHCSFKDLVRKLAKRINLVNCTVDGFYEADGITPASPPFAQWQMLTMHAVPSSEHDLFTVALREMLRDSQRSSDEDDYTAEEQLRQYLGDNPELTNSWRFYHNTGIILRSRNRLADSAKAMVPSVGL